MSVRHQLSLTSQPPQRLLLENTVLIGGQVLTHPSIENKETDVDPSIDLRLLVFSTLLLPKLSIMVSKGEESGIRSFLDRTLPQWLLATSVLFIVILLTARWALPAIFGPVFGDSVPVLELLLVASSALALFNGLVPLISASGLTWGLSIVTLISASSNVLLDFLLIPRFGIVGSAWATVLAFRS